MHYASDSLRNLGASLTDGVLTIQLQNPEMKNALTVPMMEDLRLLLDCARVDPEVRCLIITGSADSFSSGGNVKKMAEGDQADSHPLKRPLWNTPTMPAAERLERQDVTGLRVMQALWDLEKPTLAVINGVAVAAGLDLALACDLRISSDRARFGCTYAKVGLIPFDGAMYWLPRLVGLGKAFELMYLGDLISAVEAERVGLVNWVVPHDELTQRAAELAARLAAGPGVSYQLIKHMTHRSFELDFPAALRLSYEARDVVFSTEDHKNAVAAFVEKRSPQFRGR